MCALIGTWYTSGEYKSNVDVKCASHLLKEPILKFNFLPKQPVTECKTISKRAISKYALVNR